MNRRIAGAIDFTKYIEERSLCFSGRAEVFETISKWLTPNNPTRYFLLEGDPGSGKSSIAAQLCRFSLAQARPPSTSPNLNRNFLSAFHFCLARERRWIDPSIFAKSLAMQLAARYYVFGKALLELESDRRIQIRNHQEIKSNKGEVIGIYIQTIELGDLNPEHAFNQLVREPLEQLLEQSPNERIAILVDGLDEALGYSGKVTIDSLLADIDYLPLNVRFLLTSRINTRIENNFSGADVLNLSDTSRKQVNEKDIATYLSCRIKSESALHSQFKTMKRDEQARWKKQVLEASSGNFEYTRFLLDAMAQGKWRLDQTEGLPPGINALYSDSLDRVIKLGNFRWKKYAAVLGVLSVAQTELTLKQLETLSNIKRETWDVFNELRQFIREGKIPDANGSNQATYSLYHESIVDFFHRREFPTKNGELKNTFYLEEHEWHRQVASRYNVKNENLFRKWDLYGLRYFGIHLRSSLDSDQNPDQSSALDQLVSTLTNPEFQREHIRRVQDMGALIRDIEQTLNLVVLEDSSTSLLHVVETALSLVQMRRGFLDPAALFTYAKQGNVDDAEKQLDLFAADSNWQELAMITIAWLAFASNPSGARQLCRRMEREFARRGRQQLLRRAKASMNGSHIEFATLPTPPTAQEARDIVASLGGIKPSESEQLQQMGWSWNRPYGIEGMGTRNLNSGSDLEESLYRAYNDGIRLVAFAVHEPVLGTQLFEQYLILLESNSYAYYRKTSLNALLDAMLQHPEDSWVLEMLPQVVGAGLSQRNADFDEATKIALMAVEAKLKNGASALENYTREIVDESSRLSPTREQSDTWGHYKRRFAAMTETYKIVFNQQRPDLVDHALKLPYGYAGFNAPACYTLAEAIHIGIPQHITAIRKAIYAGDVSAENISESTFCLRTLARLNALEKWWDVERLDQLFDSEYAIQQLVENPGQYSGKFPVGHDFPLRIFGKDKVDIPFEVRRANTLEQLAHIFGRSFAEFQQLNLSLVKQPNQQLEPGTEVLVPDPELAPLVAARFAAEALIDPHLDAISRIHLIQSLVPIAISNPTALDTVLARLILAAQPISRKTLKRLSEIVSKYRNPLHLANTAV